jgi:5-methylcytosine-specific restriction endonuclease McrA
VRIVVAALLIALPCIAPPVVATGGGHSHSTTTSTYTATTSHSKSVPWVHRDYHGKIARDPRQLDAFKKQHPCPSTGKTYGSCPGYTVDHVIPLKRGGADSPSNMQRQTNAAAKEKDKWE